MRPSLSLALIRRKQSRRAEHFPALAVGRGLGIPLSLTFLALLGVAVAYGADSGARTPVILISIDTLRADHLSAYGYTRIRTPHIDSLAQGGTRFAHAETQVPLTLPSHTSLFTSTYPFENGVEENGERVPAGVVTLASVLQARGYKTAAFIGSDFLDQRYGLDQGFDQYDSPFGIETSGALDPRKMTVRRDGALVLRAARQYLEAHRGQPVFVFVHLFDLHLPYTLPPEVARRKGVSRYDAQLEYVDELLGRFEQQLAEAGWWDKALVVMFGDHGEGLGDHRETDHGYYVYESTLHVPLIAHWPAGAPAFAAVEAAPVGLIDVAPTILDVLRVPAPESFKGTSLLGALKAGESVRPGAVYSESLYASDAFHWAPLRAIRVGTYKYIQAPKAELYNLAADPGEQVNLAQKNAAMATELRNELAELVARYAPPRHAVTSALTPETLAELESLGYLAASPHAPGDSRRDVPLPDPKDRFAEFQAYESAFITFTEGRTAAAIPRFQAILRMDPENTLARFHLGECYQQIGQAKDALREWSTVLKQDPRYSPAAEAIGRYWLDHGDYSQARRRFQQVLALSPESFNGHFQLAVADEHLGFLPEARQHLEAACKLAPHDESCTHELKSLPRN